jgi:Helix-turn-helix domain of resolvase.
MNGFESNRRESYRRNGLFMSEFDFSELYTCLELFYKTYTACEAEVKTVLEAIENVYAREYRLSSPEQLHKVLHNPRNAGRKAKLEPAEVERIRELSGRGYSVRKIAEETGIPRSTVQRNLGPEAALSHN